MVPAELRTRLKFTAFELKRAHPRLHQHRTIIAALLWRHVDHREPDRVRALGALLDEYLEDPISDGGEEKKIGGDVPASLKWRLDGTALALQPTHERAASKAVVAALLWRYVGPERLDELVPVLEAFAAAARPRRTPTGV
jgi:hypothetical protein